MSKMQKWQKLWLEIKTIESNLGKRKHQFARDLRTDFETGETGDAKFLKFIEADLHEPLHVARMLLTLAVIERTVPDDKVRERIAVNKKVTALMHMPVRDQVAILVEAQKTGYTVQMALNDRERAQGPRPPRVDINRVASILDEHFDALERCGIPMTELAAFIAQYAKKSKAA